MSISSRVLLVAFILLSCALPAFAAADMPAAAPVTSPVTSPAPAPPLAVGFVIDLLPTALSASSKHFGGSFQTWVGVGHLRFRAVAAHLHMPDALGARDGYKDQETTVMAAIVDYVFGRHFDGFWVGTGFEGWMNNIGHKAHPGRRAYWNNAVYTIGGGYIWRAIGNFYLEPWVAGHVLLNNPSVRLDAKRYKPFPLSGEASLKIGYFFDI